MKIKKEIIKIIKKPMFWYNIYLSILTNIICFLSGIIAGIILLLYLIKILFGE